MQFHTLGPVGTHQHKCQNCGNVWEHPDTMAGNKEAHTCSQCGQEEWVKHYPGERQECADARHEMHNFFRSVFGY